MDNPFQGMSNRVAKPTLFETEVRVPQSGLICSSQAHGRRLGCLRLRALGAGARIARESRSAYLSPSIDGPLQSWLALLERA